MPFVAQLANAAGTRKVKGKGNVWIVSHAGGSPYHGPNMRSYYIGTNLVRLGYKVAIISSSYFHKYFALPRIEEDIAYENIDGIQYVWIRTTRYRTRGVMQVVNQLEFALKLHYRYQQLDLPKPDCVVLSSPPPLACFAVHSIARAFRARFIFEIRDLWPLLVSELGSFSKFHPYMLMLGIAERYCVAKSDHIVSVKPGDIDYLRSKYQIADSKFTYIPNAIELNGAQAQELPTSVASRIPTNRFVVGYVGAISAYYGLMCLVRAASRLLSENIHFVIVGSGSEKELLVNYAARHNLGNVTFVDTVKHAFVQKLISKFDLCYLGLRKVKANKYGISTNKLYEYMYGEKPILAAINTDYDPVEEADCGVSVEAENVDETVKAILKLSRLPKEQLVNMGRNGKRYLLRNHTYAMSADLYATALGRPVTTGKADGGGR